ncbi:MAG: hypothetical protein PHY92_02020 [Alphaproteobacteria bacterium]|nr:hypothetical protein [Alphaproteobacteria bacterium]
MQADDKRFESRVALAALKLAAKKPWAEITPEQIAKAAKAPVPILKKRFPETASVLPVIVSLIDAETKKNTGAVDRKATAHDRLFEVMMARFDALQTHRSGITSIAGACRQKPDLALKLLQAQSSSVQSMISLAHLKKDGAIGLIQSAGVMAIYHLALRRWMSDDTHDLAKTMSFLDRMLRNGEKVMKRLNEMH